MLKAVMLDQSHIIVIAVRGLKRALALKIESGTEIRIAQISAHGVRLKIFMNKRGQMIHTDLMQTEMVLPVKLYARSVYIALN